jgi:hypothetical protein
MVGVSILRSNGHSVSAAQATSSDASGPERLSGTYDQWVAAVCPSGVLIELHQFPDLSYRNGRCATNPGDPVWAGTIFYFQFRSNAAMEQLMPSLGGTSYAIADYQDTGAALIFYTMTDIGGPHRLIPLQQFGFAVHQGPFRR